MNRTANRAILGVVAIIVSVTAINCAYLYGERQQNHELSVSNQTLRASMMQLQRELREVNGRLDGMSAAYRSFAPPSTTALPQAPKTRATKPRRAAVQSTLRSDPRFTQLQKELSNQQKELANTRENLDNARQQLEGSISSTKNELSGSIARTHDELLALQKRGERNYYEFQLSKSKAFERVGPLRLSLRKADAKHKRFDVMMLVDDNELQKKGVNLYETLWLNLAELPQPLEVVVNRISKDYIAGYVSEPKYKKSELSASAGMKTAQ